MNFLEKEMKKGLFKEAEKAWDQNKGKFGIKTGKPAEPAPAMQPPPMMPQEAKNATAGGEQPSPAPAPYPVGVPASQAASAATGVPPRPTAPQAGAAAGAAPQAAKKQTLQEKLMAKVGAKAGDPALQAKAEKVLKTKAKRMLFKF